MWPLGLLLLAAPRPAHSLSVEAPRLEEVAWLEDAGGRLGPAEVAALPADRLRPLQGAVGAGFSAAPRWLRFLAVNPGPEEAAVSLVFRFPLVERIDLYLDAPGGPEHRRGGLALPDAEREVAFVGACHVARLTLAPGERRAGLLRVETRGSGFLGLELQQAQGERRREALELLLHGALGALAALLLLHASQCLTARRRQDLEALAFLAFQGGHVAIASGAASALLQVAPGPLIAAKAAMAAASSFAGVLFLRSFLDLPVLRPALDRVLLLTGVGALAAALVLPVSLVRGNDLVTLGGLATLAVGTAAAVDAYRAGHAAARALLPGLALFAVSTGWYLLSLLGLATPSPLVVLAETAGAALVGGAILVAVLRQDWTAAGQREGQLELLVAERTAVLSRTVDALRKEVADRRAAEASRARLEGQLHQAQKLEAVGRLAAGVAHDFNNLLTALSANVALLEEELPADHPGRVYQQEAQETIGRATALTRQLLAFTRRQPLQPRPVAVSELVSGMERLLGRLVGEEIRLSFQLAGELPAVRADPAQLEQVLLNLVVNARDAVRPGGRIEIETGLAELPGADGGPAAPHVRLAVRDDGVGMDEETRQRIFEPFFTTKGSGQGTGLGLATVYGVVQQHGGRVAVQSAPGKGATFEVFLPAAPDHSRR